MNVDDAGGPVGWSQDNLEPLVRRYLQIRRDQGRFSKSTAASRRGTLLHFAGHVRDVRPDKVTRRHVEEWLAHCGPAPATQRSRLSAVRGFWQWLILEGVVQHDPTVGITPPRLARVVPRGLRSDDVAATLRSAPDSRGRLILLLMVQEGLRCCEVAALQVGDIDVAARAVLVRGKGGHERVLPVSDQTWEAFHAYLSEHPAGDGPLIRSHLRHGAGITAGYVSCLVAQWMREAGVKRGAGDRISAHALRHTMATDALRRGAHLLDVQAALGHASIATTERYVGNVVDGLRHAMGGRSYGTPGAAAAPKGGRPDDDVPALDAIGPLIDAVAALAAKVSRLEDVPGRAGGVVTDRELVGCDVCGERLRPQWVESHRMRHCPECGELVDRGLGAHRARKHQVVTGPAPAACPWKEPHAHTPSNRCICPLCGRDEGGVVPHRMPDHFVRPHHRCPDCDQSFVNLDAHRRRAHQWAAR